MSAVCIVTVAEGEGKVIGVTLSSSFLQLKVGATASLTASVLPESAKEQTVSWESSDPSVVTVADGVLTPLKEGTAVITVTTAEGGNKASCSVTVIPSNDPMDAVDLENAAEIEEPNVFGSGIRLKSTGEILFSPTLSELRALITSDEEYDAYAAYLRFTLCPTEDPQYTYPSLLLDAKKSKGSFVDFFLQSAEESCGFCPIAGELYNIELTVVKKDAPTVGLFHGDYYCFAADNIANSEYYEPTPAGGEPPRGEGQFYIRYKVEGSGGEISGNTKQLLNKGEGSSEVIAVPKEGFTFSGWSDGVTTAARSGDKVTEDSVIFATFTISMASSLLPEIHLTTESGFPVTTKEYEAATLTVTGANDTKYNITAPLQIRGRGNSSWNGNASEFDYDSKNSYRLKFDEKLQFLGIGDSKNRDWVLQANKFDPSGLRNYLVWDLACRMGTMSYVPECTWVQLFINEEYRGMYMVCELVEAANDRVEVDDSPDTTDKGYFLEFDFRGNYDDNPYFYIDGYGPAPRRDLHGAVEIVIKSNISGDQDLQFISDYLTRCHEAIMGGDKAKIEELVDLSSFIDMFILEELSKDCDAGRASFFVKKDPGGKLCCTAPWDFDFGFGTYGPAVSPYGFACQSGDNPCEWYASLVEQTWFREAVTARIKELSPAFKATLEAVRAKAAELKVDADINAGFWDLYGTSFHQYVSSQVSANLNSYEEHIDYLVDWSETRWQDMLDCLV